MSEREETKRCPDCGSKETARHTFEECCTILREQRDEARREREEWETNSATIINGMAAEADGLRHRAEQAETALAAMTEARDLWQSEAKIQQAHRENAEKVVEAAKVQADAKRAWVKCEHRDPHCQHFSEYRGKCAMTEAAFHALNIK